MAIEVNRLYLTFTPEISETRNRQKHLRRSAFCHVERKPALSAVERVETSLTVRRTQSTADNRTRFLDCVSYSETPLGMTKESAKIGQLLSKS
jgi:hypothetical protein